MTVATLHTYLDDKGKADRAKAWLRRRNILSSKETIRRGHHCFTMLVPSRFSEEAARKTLADALAAAGIDVYEPPVFTPGDTSEADAAMPDAKRTAELRSRSRNANLQANTPSKGSMHDRIAEQVALADTYAKDGAFRTAARIFRNLADEIDTHCTWADGERGLWADKPKGN